MRKRLKALSSTKISYGKQSIDQSDVNTVLKALADNWLTQGPAIQNFENDLANYFGSNFSCAVANGTAALHLAALSLGWKKGDVIITSPNTFLATANCILYTGATPEFADIDPTSYTLDPNLVEEKIKNCLSEGKNIKAIIGVDYAGYPCDWKSLHEIANKYKLQLVNDNCHALGAVYYGDKQYAVNYADIVVQSYHPVKHITTGEGGGILTNNRKINKTVRLLRSHGMNKNPDELEKIDGPWYYEMHEPGFNYRITDFQCALGSSQLKKLDTFIDKRRKIAATYDTSFSKIEFIKTPSVHDNMKHAYHLYPVQINFEEIGLSKSDFFNSMKDSGINLQVHYIPIHLQPYYRRTYNFKPFDYPVAESFYKNEVSLPIYPDLLEDQQEMIVSKILRILNQI